MKETLKWRDPANYQEFCFNILKTNSKWSTVGSVNLKELLTFQGTGQKKNLKATAENRRLVAEAVGEKLANSGRNRFSRAFLVVEIPLSRWPITVESGKMFISRRINGIGWIFFGKSVFISWNSGILVFVLAHWSLNQNSIHRTFCALRKGQSSYCFTLRANERT